MVKKISTVLLSLLIAVFAAFQAQGAETEADRYAVRVLPKEDVSVPSGERIDGEIRITAALREMAVQEDATIKFVLTGDRYTYRTTVVVTPENLGEEGLLSVSSRFENLLSGSYRLSIEQADGAVFDYILAEKGGESKYTMQEESITFYLSKEANTGSAWFMLKEQAPGSEDEEAAQ